ncbi:MAG: carboxymuconolactone decarboxylase family protein [Chloroflexota bacterium]
MSIAPSPRRRRSRRRSRSSRCARHGRTSGRARPRPSDAPRSRSRCSRPSGPRGIAMHVRAALRNGLTREEVAEVLLHAGLYAGLPAATPPSGSPRRRWTSSMGMPRAIAPRGDGR